MKKQTLIASVLLVSSLTVLANTKPKSKGDFKAIDPKNIDTKVRPQDDFYHYANGMWIKNNPIPGTEVRWGSFSVLQDNTYKKLKGLLDEAAAAKAPKGTNQQKVGDFYASAMDSAKIEKQGISVIASELALIDRYKHRN